MGGDAVRLGRYPRVWRKVMAAYRRVDGLEWPVGLYTGISSGPTLGSKYGKTLTFTFMAPCPLIDICPIVLDPKWDLIMASHGSARQVG